MCLSHWHAPIPQSESDGCGSGSLARPGHEFRNEVMAHQDRTKDQPSGKTSILQPASGLGQVLRAVPAVAPVVVMSGSASADVLAPRWGVNHRCHCQLQLTHPSFPCRAYESRILAPPLSTIVDTCPAGVSPSHGSVSGSVCTSVKPGATIVGAPLHVDVNEQNLFPLTSSSRWMSTKRIGPSTT